MPGIYNKNKSTNNRKTTNNNRNYSLNNPAENGKNQIIGRYLNNTMSDDAVKNALRKYLYGGKSDKNITPNELFKISQMMHMVTNLRQKNKNDELEPNQIEMIAKIFGEKQDVITKISQCYVKVKKQNNDSKWIVEKRDWSDANFDLVSCLERRDNKSLNVKSSSKAILNLLLSTADYTNGFTRIYESLNNVGSDLQRNIQNQLNNIDPQKYQTELREAERDKDKYRSLREKIEGLEKNNPLEDIINDFCNDNNILNNNNRMLDRTQLNQNLVRARMAMVRINIIPNIQSIYSSTDQIHSEKIQKGAFDIFNNEFLYSITSEQELAQELREKIYKKIAGVTNLVVEEKISTVDTNQKYGLDLTTDKKYQINKTAVNYGYECASIHGNILKGEKAIKDDLILIENKDKEYENEFDKLKEVYEKETKSYFNGELSQDEIIKYMQELAIEGKIEELTKYSNIHAHLNKLKEQYKQEITTLSQNIPGEQKYIYNCIDNLTNLSKQYCKDGALEYQNNRLEELENQTKEREITTNKKIDDILNKMEPRIIPDISIFTQYANIQNDIKQLEEELAENKYNFKTVNKTEYDKLNDKYEELTKRNKELTYEMNACKPNINKISTLEKNIKNFNKETDFVSKETTKLSEQANNFNKENEKLKKALYTKIQEIQDKIQKWNGKNSKFTNLCKKLEEFKDKNIEQEINKKYKETKETNESIKKLNVAQIKADDLKAIKDILRIHEDINKQEFKYINQSNYTRNMNEYNKLNDNLSKLKESITLDEINIQIRQITLDNQKRDNYYNIIKETKQEADEYDNANTKLEEKITQQWNEIDGLIDSIKGNNSKSEVRKIIAELKNKKEKEKNEADKINKGVIVPKKYDLKLYEIEKLTEIKDRLEQIKNTKFTHVANDEDTIGEEGKTTEYKYNINIQNIKDIQEQQTKLKEDLENQGNKETINKLNKKLEEIKKDIEENCNTAQSYNNGNNKKFKDIQNTINEFRKEYEGYVHIINNVNETFKLIEDRKSEADKKNDTIKTQDIQLADTIDFDIIKKLNETLTRINNEAKFKSVNSDELNTKSKYDYTIKEYDDNKKNYNNIIQSIDNITTSNKDKIDNEAKEYNEKEEKIFNNINEYVDTAQTYIKDNENIYNEAIEKLGNLSTNTDYTNFKERITNIKKSIEQRKNTANTENKQLERVTKKTIDTTNIKEFKELNEKLIKIQQEQAQFESVENDGEKKQEDSTKKKYEDICKKHEEFKVKYKNEFENIQIGSEEEKNNLNNKNEEYRKQENKIIENIEENVAIATKYINDNETKKDDIEKQIKKLLTEYGHKENCKKLIEEIQNTINKNFEEAQQANKKIEPITQHVAGELKELKKFDDLMKELNKIKEGVKFKSVENDETEEQKYSTKENFLSNKEIYEGHQTETEELNELKGKLSDMSEEDRNKLLNKIDDYNEKYETVLKNINDCKNIAGTYIEHNDKEYTRINEQIESLKGKYKIKTTIIDETLKKIKDKKEQAQTKNEQIKDNFPELFINKKEFELFKNFKEKYEDIQKMINKFKRVNNDKGENSQNKNTIEIFNNNKSSYNENEKSREDIEKFEINEKTKGEYQSKWEEFNKKNKEMYDELIKNIQTAEGYIKHNLDLKNAIDRNIKELKKTYANQIEEIEKLENTAKSEFKNSLTINREIYGNFTCNSIKDRIKEYNEFKKELEKISELRNQFTNITIDGGKGKTTKDKYDENINNFLTVESKVDNINKQIEAIKKGYNKSDKNTFIDNTITEINNYNKTQTENIKEITKLQDIANKYIKNNNDNSVKIIEMLDKLNGKYKYEYRKEIYNIKDNIRKIKTEHNKKNEEIKETFKIKELDDKNLEQYKENSFDLFKKEFEEIKEKYPYKEFRKISDADLGTYTRNIEEYKQIQKEIDKNLEKANGDIPDFEGINDTKRKLVEQIEKLNGLANDTEKLNKKFSLKDITNYKEIINTTQKLIPQVEKLLGEEFKSYIDKLNELDKSISKIYQDAQLYQKNNKENSLKLIGTEGNPYFKSERVEYRPSRIEELINKINKNTSISTSNRTELLKSIDDYKKSIINILEDYNEQNSKLDKVNKKEYDKIKDIKIEYDNDLLTENDKIFNNISIQNDKTITGKTDINQPCFHNNENKLKLQSINAFIHYKKFENDFDKIREEKNNIITKLKEEIDEAHKKIEEEKKYNNKESNITPELINKYNGEISCCNKFIKEKEGQNIEVEYTNPEYNTLRKYFHQDERDKTEKEINTINNKVKNINKFIKKAEDEFSSKNNEIKKLEAKEIELINQFRSNIAKFYSNGNIYNELMQKLDEVDSGKEQEELINMFNEKIGKKFNTINNINKNKDIKFQYNKQEETLKSFEKEINTIKNDFVLKKLSPQEKKNYNDLLDGSLKLATSIYQLKETAVKDKYNLNKEILELSKDIKDVKNKDIGNTKMLLSKLEKFKDTLKNKIYTNEEGKEKQLIEELNDKLAEANEIYEKAREYNIKNRKKIISIMGYKNTAYDIKEEDNKIKEKLKKSKNFIDNKNQALKMLYKREQNLMTRYLLNDIIGENNTELTGNITNITQQIDSSTKEIDDKIIELGEMSTKYCLGEDENYELKESSQIEDLINSIDFSESLENENKKKLLDKIEDFKNKVIQEAQECKDFNTLDNTKYLQSEQKLTQSKFLIPNNNILFIESPIKLEDTEIKNEKTDIHIELPDIKDLKKLNYNTAKGSLLENKFRTEYNELIKNNEELKKQFDELHKKYQTDLNNILNPEGKTKDKILTEKEIMELSLKLQNANNDEKMSLTAEDTNLINYLKDHCIIQELNELKSETAKKMEDINNQMIKNNIENNNIVNTFYNNIKSLSESDIYAIISQIKTNNINEYNEMSNTDGNQKIINKIKEQLTELDKINTKKEQNLIKEIEIKINDIKKPDLEELSNKDKKEYIEKIKTINDLVASNKIFNFERDDGLGIGNFKQQLNEALTNNDIDIDILRDIDSKLTSISDYIKNKFEKINTNNNYTDTLLKLQQEAQQLYKSILDMETDNKNKMAKCCGSYINNPYHNAKDGNISNSDYEIILNQINSEITDKNKKEQLIESLNIKMYSICNYAKEVKEKNKVDKVPDGKLQFRSSDGSEISFNFKKLDETDFYKLNQKYTAKDTIHFEEVSYRIKDKILQYNIKEKQDEFNKNINSIEKPLDEVIDDGEKAVKHLQDIKESDNEEEKGNYEDIINYSNIKIGMYKQKYNLDIKDSLNDTITNIKNKYEYHKTNIKELFNNVEDLNKLVDPKKENINKDLETKKTNLEKKLEKKFLLETQQDIENYREIETVRLNNKKPQDNKENTEVAGTRHEIKLNIEVPDVTYLGKVIQLLEGNNTLSLKEAYERKFKNTVFNKETTLKDLVRKQYTDYTNFLELIKENKNCKYDTYTYTNNNKIYEKFCNLVEKEKKYETSIIIKAYNVNEIIDNNIKTTIKNDITVGATISNSSSIMKKFMNLKDESIDKQSIDKIIGEKFKKEAQEYNIKNKEKIPTDITDNTLSYVALLATKNPHNNNIKYNMAFSGFPPEKVELSIYRDDLDSREFKVIYDYNNNEYTRIIKPDLTKNENEVNRILFNAFARSLPTPKEYEKMRKEALNNYNKNKEKLKKENLSKQVETSYNNNLFNNEYINIVDTYNDNNNLSKLANGSLNQIRTYANNTNKQTGIIPTKESEISKRNCHDTKANNSISM